MAPTKSTKTKTVSEKRAWCLYFEEKAKRETLEKDLEELKAYGVCACVEEMDDLEKENEKLKKELKLTTEIKDEENELWDDTVKENENVGKLLKLTTEIKDEEIEDLKKEVKGEKQKYSHMLDERLGDLEKIEKLMKEVEDLMAKNKQLGEGNDSLEKENDRLRKVIEFLKKPNKVLKKIRRPIPKIRQKLLNGELNKE